MADLVVGSITFNTNSIMDQARRSAEQLAMIESIAKKRKAQRERLEKLGCLECSWVDDLPYQLCRKCFNRYRELGCKAYFYRLSELWQAGAQTNKEAK